MGEHKEPDNLGYRAHEGKLWRRGYTTGSCAAAAAGAATRILFAGEELSEWHLVTPGGVTLSIPIKYGESRVGAGMCQVVKDGGDDPDITHGTVIQALVTKCEDSPKVPRLEIVGGIGVGRLTKPGLALPVGSWAINPVPLTMITKEVEKNLPAGACVRVEISVPEGETLAKKTMNPQLGILGGISILGTSGIVEPMSEEAFKTSLTPQIQVALAQGHHTLILVPGRMGQRQVVEKLEMSEEGVILTSNFIGFMLEECLRLEVKKVVLFGHIGKLCKLAGGIFHTHNRVANGRLEIVAAYAALLGAGQQTIARLLDCITVEAALDIIREENLQELLPFLAEKAAGRAENYVCGQLEVGVIFTDLKGNILAASTKAREMGEQLGWNIQLL